MLCAYAEVSAEGLVTIVKGGLTPWRGPVPMGVTCKLYLHLDRFKFDVGEYPMRITCIPTDPPWSGDPWVPVADGLVRINNAAIATQLVIPIDFYVPGYGEWEISVNVGGVTANVDLHVLPTVEAEMPREELLQ